MQPRIKIRDASPSDIDIIVEFNRRLALETESKALDLAILTRGVRRGLEDTDRLRYWLAVDSGGCVLGQTAITREWSDWRDGWLWWLQSVYVEESARNQGVFKALYTHIREVAKSDPDVIGIRLYIEDHNDRARKAYLALGLAEAGYSVLEELWLGPQSPAR